MSKSPRSNWLARLLFFTDVTPFLRTGEQRPIEEDDLINLPDAEGSRVAAAQLDELYQGKVMESLDAVYHRDLRRIRGVAIGHIVFAVLTPILLNRFIYALGHQGTLEPGYMFALAIALGASVFALGALNELVFHFPRVLAVKTHGALIGFISRKVLRTSLDCAESEVINHVSADCWRIFEYYVQRHRLWAVPIQVTALLILLIVFLGWGGLVGAGLMLTVTPITAQIMKAIAETRNELLTLSEKRLNLVINGLDNIQALKLTALESFLIEKIYEIRNKEISLLKKRAWLSTLSIFVLLGSSTVVVASSILIYAALGNELTAEAVFSTMALFGLLKTPLSQLSNGYRVLIESKKSAESLDGFFSAQESPNKFQKALPINGGTELVTVHGGPSSGMSFFLESVIQRTRAASGCVEVHGSVAVVRQSEWLFDGTIRHNILFGQPFDQAKYEGIINDLCLDEDLKSFASGDATVLLGGGSNVSGGQRQRICLARALYQDADIYLLDNAFSALDPDVKKHIISVVLFERLKNKVRIVTDGSDELCNYADSHVIMRNCQANIQPNTAKTTWVSHQKIIKPTDGDLASPETKGKTLEELSRDVRIQGKIDSSVFKLYLKSFGGFALAVVIGCFAAKELTEVFANVTIAQQVASSRKVSDFVQLYIALACGSLLFIALQTYLLHMACLKASERLFKQLVRRIFTSNMALFWNITYSKIINRLSKDVESLDQTLPAAINAAFICFFSILAIVLVLVFMSPLILVFLLPIFPLYWRAQTKFRKTSREVKRLYASTRTPVFSKLSEIVKGKLSISLYRQNGIFLDDFSQRLDVHQKALHSMLIVNRWLGTRLNLINSLIILAIGILASTRANADTGMWGLAFSYGFSVVNVLTWGVQAFSDCESEFSAVERFLVLEKEMELYGTGFGSAETLDKCLIQSGSVSIRHAYCRYNKESDFVLKGLNLEVASGEAIGIIGRTGSGKSTFINLICGVLKAEQGTMSIGGVNIGAQHSSVLLNYVTVVPQSPFVAPGSVRENTDPNRSASDQILIEHFRFFFPEFNAIELDSQCDTANKFLVQVIGVIRGLIAQPKVILFDEMTSQMIGIQDDILYAYIRKHLPNSTLFFISHNHNGFKNFRRILTMKDGRFFEKEIS